LGRSTDVADGLEALQKRVDKIEYTDIKSINDELTEIKLDLKENNILTKQSIEMNAKLSDTMDSFKSAMIEITHSIKESNKETADLGRKMDSLEDKVNRTNDKMDEKFKELKSEVESVDEKAKVDLLVWCKDNWYTLILSFGFVGLIILQVFGIKLF
jgi:predicted nuclease with TOPRIM domain